MPVPIATSARIGIHRTRVRAPVTLAPAAGLTAFPVYTVDVPVARGRRRRVLHRRLDDGRTARRQRGGQRRTQFTGRLDEDAVGAVASGDLREVGTVARAVCLEQAAEFP